MNTWLMIFAISLLVFTALITIEIQLSYDVLLNLGTLQIKIFGMVIWKNNFSIIGDYLNFSNQKSKIIKIKLDLSDIYLQFINELSSYIRTKIFPLKLTSNLQLCLENAFAVSMLAGLLHIFQGVLGKKLERQFHDLEVKGSIISGYRHNILILDLSFKFAITLYDFVWSTIRSIIVVRRKHEKDYKLEHQFK